MRDVLLVVPARIGSTRLPHKPLCLLAGEPLIRRVARRAVSLGIARSVAVATDDARIADAVADLPVTVVLTGTCDSGTERVARVAELPGFAWARVVVNLQGDAPFIPAEAVEGAVREVLGGRPIGTAAGRLSRGALSNPARVKVAIDRGGCAVGFTRQAELAARWRRRFAVGEHIGVYAYTPHALRRWMGLPVTRAERRERLEQLRPLAAGMPIGVARVAGVAPFGVDTPEDLARAERIVHTSVIEGAA